MDTVKEGYIPRKRVYPLKMETIPTVETQSHVKGLEDNNGLIMSNASPDDLYADDVVSSQNTAGFEKDNDFRFKRHKNKHNDGVPSLGERLDNLKNMNPTKHIETFDSSLPPQPPVSTGNDVSDKTENKTENENKERSSSQNSHENEHSNNYNHSGTDSLSNRLPNVNHWQPMYYGMMPYQGSPMYQSQFNSIAGSMPSTIPPFLNPSMQYIPDSTYKYFPQQINPSSQLLPPPQLQANNPQYSRKASKGRKSIAEQRGRRLSIMSEREHNIISPHRDVPEEQFYRHIGNMSFSQNLQLRQLYTWCAIRGLEKLNSSIKEVEKVRPYNTQNGPSSRKLATGIIKEFVGELRRGIVDIDWEAEDYEADTENSIGNVDDTMLKDLFNDEEEDLTNNDDVTYYYNGLDVKKVAKRKRNTHRRIESAKKVNNSKAQTLLPNSKNFENETNLKILQEKVDKLKQEIDDWAHVLDTQNPDHEWQKPINKKESEKLEPLEIINQNNIYSMNDMENLLERRLNKFNHESHLLKSHTEALSQITAKKTNSLSRAFISNEHESVNSLNSNLLLKGLGEVLGRNYES